MPPKPRPRPRTAPRQTNGSGDASSSNPSTIQAQQAKSARELELDKDDVFFLRNRNRTAKDWKKLEEMEKVRESSAPADDSDAEDDIEASPRKRQRIRKNTKGGNGLPAWTRQDVTNILSSDDDDFQILEDNYGSRSFSQGATRQPNGKKRPRSRSRSLTPPPELSLQQIQHARNAVRQALETAPRPASPTNYQADESTDTIILDPELASIQRAVMLQASRSGDMSRSLTPDRGGGPANVLVKVNWRPHPLNTAAKPRTMGFKLKRHDSFNTLFDEVADEAGVLLESVVVTYDGSRVFASATPHSLKIWAEADMDASDKVTYDYLREHRHQRLPPSESHPRGRSPSLAAKDDNDSDSDVQSTQDAEEDDDTFKLVVRSGSTTKDVTLTVRPSTTCGAIVKAFLKRTGLADKYPEGRSRKMSVGGGPRLIIDGDRMAPETPISEADLEDGDLVEIAGL